MKVFALVLMSGCAWAQIERPSLGMMLDAEGALRPVFGLAASAVLGDPVLTGVVAFRCSPKMCLLKTEGATYVYSPARQQLARWDGPDDEVAATDNPRFFTMSERYIEVITESGRWALCIEPGHESLFLLPGAGP